MLQKIQIFKLIGDVDSAKEFYDHYSSVNGKFLAIRQIIIENEPPRRLELFHNLVRNDDNSIKVIEYPETYEGIIESYIDRFNDDHNKEIYDQWTKYNENFFKNN